ncbi:MAG: hypothetical protein QXX79_03330 [Candidatus Bathyarchaeia archaeon]
MVFFTVLKSILQKPFIAIGMFFLHNVLVISLILLGMSFYVNLVISNFFKREKYSYIVLEYPRVFAIIFTVIVVFLSISRGGTLIYGQIAIETLPMILLMSTPVGLIEGYGVYLTIKNTLSRTLSMKGLIYIYSIFLVAAVVEVGFISLLVKVLTA